MYAIYTDGLHVYFLHVRAWEKKDMSTHTHTHARAHSLTHPLTYSLTHTGFTIIFLYIHILYTMNNLDSFRELPT